jgi:hypothetical protein
MDNAGINTLITGLVGIGVLTVIIFGLAWLSGRGEKEDDE